MRLYDISLSVSPTMPTWPGDPQVELERFLRMEDGEVANVSRVAMGLHTGTHIDAPFHFVADGLSVDRLPLKMLIGRAYVVHVPEAAAITAEVLENAEIPPRTRRVLFKTRNSDLWAQGVTEFRRDYVALTPDGASLLVQRGVKLVGVDYLSVAPFDDPVPTHRILLDAGVVILEGLNLHAVEQGRYTLYCLPIKFQGVEGAPARAVLVGA